MILRSVAKLTIYKFHLLLLLLNLVYFLSLFHTYAGHPFIVGGMDVSQILLYFTRIECGQIPYVNYYPIYGPLFYYLAYFIYWLFGNDLASFYLSYWVIWNLLGYVSITIFAYYLFEKKRYACYLMLIVLIYNSAFIGGNGYSLRMSPLFLLMLFLLKRPNIKSWDFIFGIILGITYFYDITVALTLSMVTFIFFLLLLFIKPKEKLTQYDVIKMFLGFGVSILVVMLFLAYNGELTNTLSFTISSISRGAGYLAETPFDKDGFSFNGLIKIFYEDKYFYLLLFGAYVACLIYILFKLCSTKKIDRKFAISLLLFCTGAILCKRVMQGPWRSQDIQIIPVFAFLFYNLESKIIKCGGKNIFICEGAIVFLVIVFSLMTSNHIKDLKNMLNSKDTDVCIAGNWNINPNGQDFNFKQYYTPIYHKEAGIEAKDQESTTGDSLDAYFGYPARNLISQGFRTRHSGKLTKFEVELTTGAGSPTGSVTCYLYDDNNGLPCNSLGNIGTPLDKRTITNSWAWYTFNEPFDSAPSIVANTQYHLVLYSPDTDNGYIRAHSQSGSGSYENGATYIAASQPQKELIFFEKAGMNVSKEEENTYRDVLSFLEENLDKDETFYEYPWGLYNFFLRRDVPVKINETTILSYFKNATTRESFEKNMIRDLQRKDIRYIVMNLMYTSGIVGKGRRGDVSDYIGWGDSSSPAIVETQSKLALFILENFETIKEFPNAIILRKRKEEKKYPINKKCVKIITSSDLEIVGAKTIVQGDKVLLTDIGKNITVRYRPESPQQQYSSLLKLDLDFIYNPLSGLLTQGIFHTQLRLLDDEGREFTTKAVWNMNRSKDGYLDFPFIHTPIKIKQVDLSFDFSPSKFNAPPSKIYLYRMHILLHQDKDFPVCSDS